MRHKCRYSVQFQQRFDFGNCNFMFGNVAQKKAETALWP